VIANISARLETLRETKARCRHGADATVIANISAGLETLRETKARRKTEARTSQIEALEKRLWQLENPG